MGSEKKSLASLLRQIKELILNARKTAVQTVDHIQVATCFEIGRRIVDHEQHGAHNRLLRCYVLIDLKIGKLTHQDLGQMQMYVNYFDRHVKTPDERPTVGIILCKKKHDAMVEIPLPKDANIFASQYQLYLPTKEGLRQKLLDWMGEQGEER
jgi:hypothetical protein